jgi:hypothetical protein
VEARIGLAVAHRCLDELDQARTCADDALTVTRRVGYRMLEGRALTARAAAEPEAHRAAALARRAAAIHRETGHRLGLARTLSLLSAIAEPDARTAHARAASALFAEMGAAPDPSPAEIRARGC